MTEVEMVEEAMAEAEMVEGAAVMVTAVAWMTVWRGW
jgi:hypothetical protein